MFSPCIPQQPLVLLIVSAFDVISFPCEGQSISSDRYDKTPMQYTENFNGCKNDNFQLKQKMLFFFIFAQTLIVGIR